MERADSAKRGDIAGDASEPELELKGSSFALISTRMISFFAATALKVSSLSGIASSSTAEPAPKVDKCRCTSGSSMASSRKRKISP